MPLFNSQQQSDRSNGWLGIAAIVAVEILALLKFVFAVVRYVEWLSDAAQAEFMSATTSSASVPNYSGEVSTSILVGKGANEVRSEGLH